MPQGAWASVSAWPTRRHYSAARAQDTRREAGVAHPTCTVYFTYGTGTYCKTYLKSASTRVSFLLWASAGPTLLFLHGPHRMHSTRSMPPPWHRRIVSLRDTGEISRHLTMPRLRWSTRSSIVTHDPWNIQKCPLFAARRQPAQGVDTWYPIFIPHCRQATSCSTHEHACHREEQGRAAGKDGKSLSGTLRRFARIAGSERGHRA